MKTRKNGVGTLKTRKMRKMRKTRGTEENEKYWHEMKPMPSDIKDYKKKYGSGCFLLPRENKYPICNKTTGRIECKGLRASNYRAMLSVYRGLKPKTYSYRGIANKARSMARRKKCNWSMTKRSK